jgi:rhodanese-related sulfurtransferase/rubrerythrin
MNILDYFKQVPTISPPQVRELIAGMGLEDYVLLDVRQPKEYKRGHLAGAVLIPVADLPERIHELNPQKTTIVYCAIGGRSRAAVAMLLEAGFREVFNMSGGIKGWNGIEVEGPPDAGTAYFAQAKDPQEILLLAWIMEEGTRRFYEIVARWESQRRLSEVFTELAAVEATHQEMLNRLLRQSAPEPEGESLQLRDLFEASENGEPVIEGQLKLKEALDWASNRQAEDILSYTMSLEAALFDLYVRLSQQFPSGQKHAVFSQLAKQEKSHLQRFAYLLEDL